jgi:hypothetical protein
MDDDKDKLTPILRPEADTATDEAIKQLLDSLPEGTNLSILRDIILNIVSFITSLRLNTVDTNNFIDINILESLLMKLNIDCKALNLDLLIDELTKIDQGPLINKKKIELLAMGIKVRNYRYFDRSILSLQGKVPISRMGLIPSTADDAMKLKNKGFDKIIFPFDEALGIAHLPYKMTVSTMLEVAYWVQSSTSYKLAAEHLNKSKDLKINVETIRSVANTVGKIVFDNDVKTAEKYHEMYMKTQLDLPIDKTSDNSSHILYLETDGAMLHTRQKNDDGTSWRENKLGIAFSSEDFTYYKDKKTKEIRPQIGTREYCAYLGPVETFKWQFFSLALRKGYGSYGKTILISDGATWIRNMKEELFPDAQQILDYFHLCEHVTGFAKVIFNNIEEKYRPWSDKICELFKKSKIKEAISIIKPLNNIYINKTTNNFLNYINNNINNIDYDNYLKNGYFIGSGAIESANRSVLQQRLKQPGMRWNIDCGQYIVTLMAKAKSNHWETKKKNNKLVKEKANLWEKDVVKPVLRYYSAADRIAGFFRYY